MGMRVFAIIAGALAASVAAVAVLLTYVIHGLPTSGSWQADLFQAAWTHLGLCGFLLVLVYALLAAAIVVGTTLIELDVARDRLRRGMVQAATDAHYWLADQGSALAPLGPRLLATVDSSLRGAPYGDVPLSCYREIRAEIWCAYLARLAIVEAIAVAIYCATIVATRLLAQPLAPPLAIGAESWTLFAAALAVAVVGTWLAVNREIDALIGAMAKTAKAYALSLSTQKGLGNDRQPPKLSAQMDGSSSERTTNQNQMSANGSTLEQLIDKATGELATRIETNIQRLSDALNRHADGTDSLVEQLIERLATATADVPAIGAGSPILASSAPTTAPAKPPETLLSEAIDQQRIAVEQFTYGAATQIERFGLALEDMRVATENSLRNMSDEMVRVATSVERMTQRLVPAVRRLVTADEKLSAVAEARDNLMGDLEKHWQELSAGLQASHALIERFVELASRDYRERHLMLIEQERDPPDAPKDSDALSRELQALLDEISDGGDTPPNPATPSRR
jgi:hypothetical protein